MKKLLFILSLFFIITSCNKTPIITLSVDKEVISADGKEFVTFKVISTDKHNNEEDVTNDCQIFFTDSKLELGSTTFSTTEPKSYSFYATYEDAVSNEVSITAIEVEEEPEKPIEPEDPIKPEEPVVIPIVLSASTDTITANGEDVITFTVMQDTADVTNLTEIFVNENLISGNVFKTETAGSYNVIAKLNDSIVSNQISFFAKEVENNEEPVVIPIVLSASTDTITANGEDVITFTVMQDTVNVTNLTEIFINENLISGNVFKTETAGSYNVIAKLNDSIVSNQISFFAKEVENNEEPEIIPITLSASKTTILNNGKDHIIFTVMQDSIEVTAKSKIYVGETKLKLNVFTSKTAGTYTAYAMLGEIKSNEITITVEDEKPEEPEEKPIVLTASKTNITADGNDAVTFTVKQEDNDVTSETEIYVNDNKINGNTFTTTTAGTYKAYAKKGELKSNEISITAEAVVEPEKPIELIASTTNITANGSDAVTFTVMQENNDVTSQASIFVNNQKLASNVFTTYTAGTYTAYAQKNDAKSNEITIYVEAVADMGKTIVFADGVSISSGWYDVNKLTKGGADVNMCWAAASANIIQWWQDRYVELGHTLPSTAITGAGTKTYDGTKYNLAIMEAYRDLWDNSRGGSVSHGVTWYFEGRNIMKEASAGTHAQPLNANTGGYYSNDWNSILPNIYHGYDYVIVPGILEYKDLISGEFNNYSIWGNGSGLSGNASLKKFSDLVVEFIDRGVTSLTVALAANLGSIHHATTLWGYEIDNATGIITKVWLTDSDDIHQNGESGNPTQQMLREYAVSYTEGTGTIKFAGAPYGACYAVSLYPVSKYGSR